MHQQQVGRFGGAEHSLGELAEAAFDAFSISEKSSWLNQTSCNAAGRSLGGAGGGGASIHSIFYQHGKRILRGLAP